MIREYLWLILITLLLLNLLSDFWFSSIIQLLGILTLLFTLALSIHTIIHKHAGTAHARAKIFKEVGVMIFTLVVIIFMGGIAAMLANAQVSVRWGEVAGLLSAIGASVTVGYLVRVGMGRLVKISLLC